MLWNIFVSYASQNPLYTSRSSVNTRYFSVHRSGASTFSVRIDTKGKLTYKRWYSKLVAKKNGDTIKPNAEKEIK